MGSETMEKGVAPVVAKTHPTRCFVMVEVVLRFLVFASAVAAVVVMVTSNQTEKVRMPFPPFIPMTRYGKFSHSPALIYFVVAFAVAALYAIITTLFSFFGLIKPGCCSKVLSHFIILDVILLGIVASALGAAGGVGYVGLKGNSHTGWFKICDNFDIFCRHIAGSLAVALFGSVVLVLLILISVHSLSKKIPK